MTVCELRQNGNYIFDNNGQLRRKTRKKRRSGISDLGVFLDSAVSIGASSAIANGLDLSGAPYFLIFMISCTIIGGLLTAFFDNIGF